MPLVSFTHFARSLSHSVSLVLFLPTELVAGLEDHVIARASCGKSHSLAVNEWGQLFAWGSNSMHQLGLDSAEEQNTPKLVKSLATKHIVQIASGSYHNLALTVGLYIYILYGEPL